MIRTLILMSFLLAGCGPLMKWQIDYPDNKIEEMVEKVIEKKFGKDIDLSPVTGKETQSEIFDIEYGEENE